MKKLANRVAEGAKNKKNIIRWLCFGSGIVLLALYNLKYVLPWTDIYFGAAIFYMIVLISYVMAKELADRCGASYSKTKIGEWLGIAWIANFIILWLLRAILTAIDPVRYKEILIVSDDMSWIAGETAILFIFSEVFAYFKPKNKGNDSK